MTGGVVTLLPTTANDGLYGGATTDAAWNFHGTYKGKTWTSSDSDKDYGFAAKSGEAVGGEAVEAGQFVRFAPGAFIKPMLHQAHALLPIVRWHGGPSAGTWLDTLSRCHRRPAPEHHRAPRQPQRRDYRHRRD